MYCPNSDDVHIFIDEAGDPGVKFKEGSSRYFIVGAAFFPDVDYFDCVNYIRVLKRNKKNEPLEEVKFNSTLPEPRLEMLKLLVGAKGKFGYIYVDKMTYDLKSPKSNFSHYHDMVSCLIRNLIGTLGINRNVRILIDERSKEKHRKPKLSTSLHKEINPVLKEKDFSVHILRSDECNGLQCVDFICGSVFQMIERQKDYYYNIIKNNLILKIQLV